MLSHQIETTGSFLTFIFMCFQLKLKSDIANFQQSAKKTRKQLVTFGECATYLIHWRILHFDPQLRMETEGLPVPVSCPRLHTRNPRVEKAKLFSSTLGDPIPIARGSRRQGTSLCSVPGNLKE